MLPDTLPQWNGDDEPQQRPPEYKKQPTGILATLRSFFGRSAKEVTEGKTLPQWNGDDEPQQRSLEHKKQPTGILAMLRSFFGRSAKETTEGRTIEGLTYASTPELRAVLVDLSGEASNEDHDPCYNVKQRAHIKAHREMVRKVQEKRDTLRLTPFQGALMRYFAARHDWGYGDSSHEPGYDAKQAEEEQRAAFRLVAECVCALPPEEAQVRAQELYDYFEKNKANELISKILGHAVKSIAVIVRELRTGLTARGMHPEKADAQASAVALLFASHHAGFPINFVADVLLKGKAVPQELRRMLLIDDGASPGDSPQEKDVSADALRERIVEVAVRAGIDRQDAIDTVSLGFAFDRLMPGHPSEFYIKKGALVTGNILSQESDPTHHAIEEFNKRVTEQLKGEAQTGLQTARVLGASWDVLRFIELQVESDDGIPAKRIREQQTVLAYVRGQSFTERALQLCGGRFSGQFADVDADIQLLEDYRSALCPEEREKELPFINSLLNTLRCIEGELKAQQEISEDQVQGCSGPVDMLFHAVNRCPRGRRRFMLQAILKEALCREKAGESPLLEVGVVKGGEEADRIFLNPQKRNKYVYVVLDEGLRVEKNGETVDALDPPNICGEISGPVNEFPIATVKVRKQHEVRLLRMPGGAFGDLCGNEDFQRRYRSLTGERITGDGSATSVFF